MREKFILEREPQHCKHDQNPSECEACVLEQQPSWETIKKIRGKSEFKRSNEFSVNCEIELSGEKFKIETIEDGKSPVISDVQKMLEKTFSAEELDSEEVLRSAVDGKTSQGTESERYRIITVHNEKNELVAFITGSQLALLAETGESTKESVYYVGYVITDKKTRQKGLAREAYVSALIDATKDARLQGNKLKFVIGEGASSAEKFINSFGSKRLYVQTGVKKEYTELKYIQPALDFDENTGEISKGAGEVPEHLMIGGLGQGSPTKEDVKKTYEAMMRFNSELPEEAFNNKGAHENQKKYIADIKEKFKSFLDNNGQLIFLDAENRKKAKEEGVVIHEHKKADHGKTGEEDF